MINCAFCIILSSFFFLIIIIVFALMFCFALALRCLFFFQLSYRQFVFVRVGPDRVTICLQVCQTIVLVRCQSLSGLYYDSL